MDDILRILLEQIVTPAVVALAAAFGGWLVSRLPGPIADSLNSAVHRRDVELVVNAMARRAAAQVSTAVATGTGPSDVIRYVRENLPDVVNKLGLSDTALVTMAGAALVSANKPAVVVAPADVLVAPGDLAAASRRPTPSAG